MASDANKTLENPDDDWLCWAATAANVLAWGDWGTSLANSSQAIFQEFQTHWTDATGLMNEAWNWWIDGTEPDPYPGLAEVDVPGGGNHWNEYVFTDYFRQDWVEYSSGQWGDGSWFMETFNEYLHDGYGTSLAIYSANNGHALTGWGYEYDDSGVYTGIWITDSDDYVNELVLLSVELDVSEGLWYLDSENMYGYQGYTLGGIQALAQRPAMPHSPVPEPSMIMLLGSGLAGLLSCRRKQTRN